MLLIARGILASRMGLQGRQDDDMYTMPMRDTVAGDALSRLSGSNKSLQLVAISMRSPLARVRVLLSSSTELRFSIHTASTGPSSTNQVVSVFFTCETSDG